MALPAERAVGVSSDELTAELVEEFRIEPLVLNVEGTIAEQAETQVDVRHDQMRMIIDRSRPFHVSGTVITYFVPFTGEADLFDYQPSSFTTVWPTGRIKDGHVELRFEAVAPTPETVKRAMDEEIARLQKWVGFANSEVEAFNAQLQGWLSSAAG